MSKRRDEKNLAVLKAWKDGLIPENHALSMLILEKRTQKGNEKYIRKLMKEINKPQEQYNGPN